MATISADKPPHWWRPNVVYGFPESETQARDFAQRCGAGAAQVAVHHFPDGESLVTALPASGVKGRTVAVYRSLHLPNAKLIEVLLAASAIRAQGAARVILITPYMPYMRQDKAFRPGEAVSQVVVAKLLAEAFDGVITVQPHLHRTHAMSDVFGEIPVMVLSAGDAIGQDIVGRGYSRAVIVGPDEESVDLVRDVVGHRDLSGVVANKKRFGDRDVRITLPTLPNMNGWPVIIVDDIVSSGGTLATLAKTLRDAGAQSISAYVVHALFDDQAAAVMQAAGIDDVRSVSCVPHASNAISVVDLIARELGCQK